MSNNRDTVPDAGLEGKPGPLTTPPQTGPWSRLRAISLRCVTTVPRGFCQWHSHPFHELCLTTDGRTLTGLAGKLLPTEPNTLFYYRPHEEHGFWNDEHQHPHFWVVHYVSEPQIDKALDFIRQKDPALRAWSLTVAQAETFKWLFMRLSAEHARSDASSAVAESGWLRILSVNIHRWAAGEFAPAVAPEPAKPRILKLWHMIQECAGRPSDFKAKIREFPNYNSLRQEFTAAFGCSPSQLAMRTRMQIARNLLLESPLNIKQIAEELGYERQHEFTRAFHRETGQSPTAWRENPK